MKKVLLLIVYILQLQLTVDAQTFCLDSTFADDGIKIFLPRGKGRHAYPLENGKILYAEYNAGLLSMKRLNEDGSEDLSFGSIPYPIIGYPVTEIAEGKDGSLYLRLTQTIGNISTVFLKVDTAGQIDSTYGDNGLGIVRGYVDSGGIMVWKEVGMYSSYMSMAVHSDGKVILGTEKSLGDRYIHLVRFTAEGFVDTAFGDKGHILIPNGYGGPIAGICIMEDERIVIGGIGDDEAGNRSLYLMRLLPDGNMDSSFNHTGKLYTRLHMEGIPYGKAIALQPDGRILLSGNVGAPFVVRFCTDGNLDTTFNHTGVLILQGSLLPEQMLWHDDRIYILSRVGDVGYTSYGLHVLLPSGVPDSAFCNNGGYGYTWESGKEGLPRRLYVDKKNIFLFGSYNGWSGLGAILLIKLKNKSDVDQQLCKQYIYPNPVLNQLYLEGSVEGSIAIIDNLGRTVLSKELYQQNSMDVSKLAPGIYYLYIRNKDSTICTYKFVKQ